MTTDTSERRLYTESQAVHRITTMHTLEQQIAQQTHGLPESAKREVLHYIEFIRSRYPITKPTTKTAGKRKISWSETPLYGLWQDREDMADPAAYVRHLRRSRF
jgi:hypothetical protein